MSTLSYIRILFSIALALGSVSCKPAEVIDAPEHPVQLQAPSHIWFERISDSMLKVSWRSDTASVASYIIYNGEEKIGTASNTVSEYVITSGLALGDTYQIGICAEPSDEHHVASEIGYSEYKMVPKADIPSSSIESVNSTAAALAFSVRIRNVAACANPEFGICWCERGVGDPTMEDNYLAGPAIPESGPVLQVIPNTCLDYGKEYSSRVFIRTDEGVYYGETEDVSLGDGPEAIVLDWTKYDSSAIPAEIEVYGTTSKLNGRNFRAWYAICDLQHSDIELRTNIPNSVATIDDQSASFYGDCYLLVNGGYFAAGEHTGIAINDYIVTGSISNARGSIDPSDKENNERYPTTRGIFGVDDVGRPSAMWAAGSAPQYFASPMPSVKGEQKYPMNVSEWESANKVDWSPRAAISAGPLLLKNGKCPFDFTSTPRGGNYYYSNYEFIADDIFGSDVYCDRTAIGCTAEGKTVIFICDGRISASRGATLLELAMIMKGIGCTDALNLDGGGSTGMMVGTTHVGDITGGNRKVKSTVGFFRKK